MPHKAGPDFFSEKREWSERKDRILGSYLTAYLPKVARLGRSILVVDAFAGPGVFGDHSPGSPLIICQTIARQIQKNPQIRALLIEPIPTHFEQLKHVTKQFGFATCVQGTFSEHLGKVLAQAERSSALLYLDPWTVEGLIWDEISIVASLVSSEHSVEILMNLNAVSFVRRALGAFRMIVPKEDAEIEDIQTFEPTIATSPSIERLNQVAGGDWWQPIVQSAESFPRKVHAFADGYCKLLRDHFPEVGKHDIKALPHHEIPKYFLLFGTRHVDGLILINDEFVKSQHTLAKLAEPEDPTLFEMRSDDLVPDKSVLPGLVLTHLSSPAKRGDVIADVIRANFCRFLEKDIRGCIQVMLKSGRLLSSTGKTRINNEVVISRADP